MGKNYLKNVNYNGIKKKKKSKRQQFSFKRTPKTNNKKLIKNIKKMNIMTFVSKLLWRLNYHFPGCKENKLKKKQF